MKQPPPPTRPTTVLNRVAPTVVRRRVVEVPVTGKSAAIGYAAADDEDDEAGPPSSVNVARALASLRGHELQRLEKILSDEDTEESEAAAASEQREREDREREEERAPASVPRVPVVRVGPTIALTVLAERLGVDAQEVVTALVTHGFFSVTVRTTLPRETARSAATLFGYRIEETDEAPAPSGSRKPAKASSKDAKDAKTTKAGSAAKGKPSKKPAVTRRTSRRA